jgi:hypothetical protein
MIQFGFVLQVTGLLKDLGYTADMVYKFWVQRGNIGGPDSDMPAAIGTLK